MQFSTHMKLVFTLWPNLTDTHVALCLLAACATTPQFTAQDCCYGNSSTTGYNV